MVTMVHSSQFITLNVPKPLAVPTTWQRCSGSAGVPKEGQKHGQDLALAEVDSVGPGKTGRKSGRKMCVKTLVPCSSHQNSWDIWM